MTFLKWLCGAQDLNVDNLLCQKRNVIAIETQCDDPAIVHLTCCTAPTTKRASNMTMQEQKKLSPKCTVAVVLQEGHKEPKAYKNHDGHLQARVFAV